MYRQIKQEIPSMSDSHRPKLLKNLHEHRTLPLNIKKSGVKQGNESGEISNNSLRN